MRHWREREFERKLSPGAARSGLRFWAFFAERPKLYRRATRAAMAALKLFGGKKRRFSRLPLAAGWTEHRDFPAPEGKTFMAAWAEAERAKEIK